MSDQRNGGIEWTDETWNSVRGCSRVSEGCRNCYAQSPHCLNRPSAGRDLPRRLPGGRAAMNAACSDLPLLDYAAEVAGEEAALAERATLRGSTILVSFSLPGTTRELRLRMVSLGLLQPGEAFHGHSGRTETLKRWTETVERTEWEATR